MRIWLGFGMRWDKFSTPLGGDTVSLKSLQPVDIISMEQHNSILFLLLLLLQQYYYLVKLT